MLKIFALSLLLSFQALAIDIFINGKNYEVESKAFAQGAFGEVFRVYDKHERLARFIVKIPKKKELIMDADQEIYFHEALSVLAVKTVWATRNPERDVILKPFVNGPTLSDLLKKPDSFNADRQQKLKTLMKYLAKHGIWINDLHTSNLMFDTDRGEWVVVDGDVPLISDKEPKQILSDYREYMHRLLDNIERGKIELFESLFTQIELPEKKLNELPTHKLKRTNDIARKPLQHGLVEGLHFEIDEAKLK